MGLWLIVRLRKVTTPNHILCICKPATHTYVHVLCELLEELICFKFVLLVWDYAGHGDLYSV